MNKILLGDVLEKMKELPDNSVQCVVTSPPYWGLRDYGVAGQFGLEKTPEKYVAKLVEVFREVRRVLKPDGVLWLNLGDSYATSKQGNTEINKNKRAVTHNFKKELPPNLKHKDLVGIPWRVAFALQAAGWYLRQDIIWAKKNCMPESVTDRCTKSHEYIFLLTKSSRYFYDNEAVKEPLKYPPHAPRNKKVDNNGYSSGSNITDKTKIWGANGKRNLRSVWTITTKPYKGAHFATFPEQIPEICIKAGTKLGDVVLDPFAGSGTTLAVAKRLGRKYVGIELNEKYLSLIEERLAKV